MDTIFDLSLQRLKWLGVRQARVAENIANANTPNFKARDVAPFSEVMIALLQGRNSDTDSTVTSTGRPVVRTSLVSSSNQTFSGNSVNTEDELLKLSDNVKSYALATNVTRSYQRLILASVKGSA